IDMGLSRRTTKPEDWAVDMRLIKEILSSAHARVLEESWEALTDGYAQTMPRHAEVLRLVARIESRGRYARVV
ncbi:MAG: Kae1-associated kinase Bud32, partial [Nitrosopumilaceae archaeon]|nr:Kae1-associated kinase Bud32 [Nitrosopumilaceae archaeon]